MRTRFNLFLGVLVVFMVFLQLTMFMVVLNDRNSNFARSNDAYTQDSKATAALKLLAKSIHADSVTSEASKQSSASSSSSSSLPVSLRPVVSLKSHQIDMERDYHPFVDFHFVWPEVKPDLKGERDFFMVVLANSAAHGEKYRLRRQGVRSTWANPKSCENLKAKNKWLVLFSLGKVYDEAEDGAILNEAKQHNDLLVGNFKDFYLNNVIKTFMGQLWAYSTNTKYILKCDDDVYIRLPPVMDWLAAKKFPTRYYGGAPYHNFNVDRDPKGKWAVSYRYFNESKFPPFCAGAFNVLSHDVLPLLFNYVNTRRPFHTDDAYIGIAARDLKIDVLRIDGLMLEDNMPSFINGYNNCRLQQARGFGHSLEPNLLHMLEKKYDSMCTHPIKC